MSEFFDIIWLILTTLLGYLNTIIGWLIDIKLFDTPFLVVLLFFDFIGATLFFFLGDEDEDDEMDLIENELDNEDSINDRIRDRNKRLYRMGYLRGDDKYDKNNHNNH